MAALYITAGIILLVLLLGLVISRDLEATREITIHKPVTEVFNYIKYLKNQDNFSKWATMDPGMKKEFRGTDATPGFVSAWDGNKKVGKGEQEIKTIEDNRKISFEIRFEKPFKSVAQAVMTTTAAGDNATTVTWGFKSQMTYPMNVMKLFMNMNNVIGNDFSTGLNNLKSLLEK